MNINLRLLILLSLFLPLSLNADERRIGTTSASFLKIGVGAKAVAMGDTACAIVDDSTSIYWNPACLAFMEHKELSYIHNLWFADIKHGFLGYAHPTKGLTLGIGINYLTMGETEETTEAYPRGTGKKFSIENDIAAFLSLSKRIERLSLGMNIKYINQKVADRNANTYATDLGLLCKLHRLRIGLSIQNIGKKMKFEKEDFHIPFNIKIGIAYKGSKNSLGLDVNIPEDNKMSYHIGGEYWMGDILALRVGYNSKISTNRLGEFLLGEGVTAGFGINIKRLQLDFAYIPFGDFGDTYRVSLIARFGRY